MEDKLKPCPFCGEKKKIAVHYMVSQIRWSVYCKHCYCGTRGYLDKEWNRRADNGRE